MRYIPFYLLIVLAGCSFHRAMYLHVTGDKLNASLYGTLNNAEVTYNATTDYSFGNSRSALNSAK